MMAKAKAGQYLTRELAMMARAIQYAQKMVQNLLFTTATSNYLTNLILQIYQRLLITKETRLALA